MRWLFALDRTDGGGLASGKLDLVANQVNLQNGFVGSTPTSSALRRRNSERQANWRWRLFGTQLGLGRAV